MGKITKILAVLILVLGISACSKEDQPLISEKEAKEIILKDANVSESKAIFSSVKLDKEDNEYELKFTAENVEYDYTVDAIKGDVLDKESEMLPAKDPAVQSVEDEYLQKALDHFAFTKDQVANIKIEKDFDDGREVYDVSFYKDNMQYTCEFDTTTKELIKSESDND